jgi:hypothetical protein
MGERFVVDLHSDFPVYLEDPKPYLPEKTSRKASSHMRTSQLLALNESEKDLLCDEAPIEIPYPTTSQNATSNG